VYQQFINCPSLTVYENRASPLRVAGINRSEVDARAKEAARSLRLEDLLQRLPTQLSGSQQRRTAIARTLVKRAEGEARSEPKAVCDVVHR
jgi:glycerol transport system ATP-binding protein